MLLGAQLAEITQPSAGGLPLMSTSSPVLFLIFNRPATTARVFEALRQAKPPRLYVAGDGQRTDRHGEERKVARARELATAVDWPCEVHTLFREENLGCKAAVSDGISWFFRHEERGIILEDDCLPARDFFPFCEALLDRYALDERVSVITGTNVQHGRKRGETGTSYYFSRYNHCWGWAAWRRSWRQYQGEIPFWPAWSGSSDWRARIPDPVERRYWQEIFERVRAGQIDSWAYPWTASVWYHGGLTATPNVNLVSNIGFGEDSTHTAAVDSPLAAMATGELGTLVHPGEVLQDAAADRYAFDHAFGGREMRFPRTLLRQPRRSAGRLYRKLRGALG